MYRFFKGKAVAGIPKRLVWLLAASAMLAGCTGGLEQWRSEQARAKAEFAHVRTEQHERDNYTTCLNQGALPGTAENLACQLDLAKKDAQAAKPQGPVAKTP